VSLTAPLTATVACANAEPAETMSARATPAITRNMHNPFVSMGAAGDVTGGAANWQSSEKPGGALLKSS
jgi:hypothetical protein